MGPDFKIGFMGATITEASRWSALHAENAKTICVPFAGSGRDIAAMSGEGKTIESWDTQHLSRLVIEGIFTAKRPRTTIHEPKYLKGHMYETRALIGIDDRSAGLIDFIGKYGTDLDKVALASAIVRCTLMGRMTHWHADVNVLWQKFGKERARLAKFVNLPGTFIHHEASFFDEPPTNEYDAIQIDPPKVVSSSDIYSAYYNDLNTILGGTIILPRWGWRDVPGHMRQVFEVPAARIIMLYVSDVRPPVTEIRRLLLEQADIIDEKRFLHRSRYDYGMLGQRRAK